MKKITLMAMFMLMIVGCTPTPIAPPSFVGVNTNIVKIGKIPEHGCDVYLISGSGIYNQTITVCPRLSAETTMNAEVGSSKHRSLLSGQVVESDVARK